MHWMKGNNLKDDHPNALDLVTYLDFEE